MSDHYAIRRSLPGFGMFVSIDLEPHEIRAIRATDGDVREGIAAALDGCATTLDEADREYVLDAMEAFVQSTVARVSPPGPITPAETGGGQ